VIGGVRAWCGTRDFHLRKVTTGALALAIASISSLAIAGETPAPEGAKVYFINLKNGDTIQSPVSIQFGLAGMGVAPAGTEKEHTGHHHLIIDETLEGDELNESIPADDNHKHFSVEGRPKQVSSYHLGSTRFNWCSVTGAIFRMICQSCPSRSRLL
jgi:uncharacterized protein DUF4399